MYSRGRGSRDFLGSLDLQQPMQSVYITIKVVSWNPVHGEALIYLLIHFQLVWFMVFNATFINIADISWWAVLLMEETEVHGENHRPVVSH
jgi:hypothetical protein